MSGPLPTFHAPRRASAGHPTVARGAAARPLRRTGRVASARIALPRRIVDSVIAPGWSYPLCACSEFAPAHRPLRVRPHWRRRRCRTGTPTPSVPRTYGKRWIKCSNQNLDEAARSNAASGRPCIRYHGIITSGGAADSRGTAVRRCGGRARSSRGGERAACSRQHLPGSRAQIAVSGCDMTLAFSAYDSVFALLDCLAACQSHVIINSVAHLFKLSLHLAAGVRHLGRLGHVFVKLILAERII